MDDKTLATLLSQLLGGADDEDVVSEAAEMLAAELKEAGGVASARTYEEAMVLCNDGGVSLKMRDGSEFQITIVRVA